jgi:hypothetical protein
MKSKYSVGEVDPYQYKHTSRKDQLIDRRAVINMADLDKVFILPGF